MNETPKRRRIIVCRGQFCNESRRADKLLQVLQPLLDELNGDQYPPPIKLEIANCLSMCGGGPNLIIRPGEIVCNGVKPDDIPTIVNQHLRD